MGRQSGARNAGLARAREAMVRRDTKGGMGIAYNNGGEQVDVPGDDQGPFIKSMPFPSSPTLWLETTFNGGLVNGDPVINEVPAAEYGFLSPLEIGHVRTITTWFEFVGNSALDSVLSIVPGSVLPDADPLDFVTQMESAANRTATQAWAANFYPFGVVDLTPTAITFVQNLGTGPAISRDMMPAEFRTVVLNGADAAARTVRFSLEWEVAPFERFTLALTDLTADVTNLLSTLKVFYSYSL